MATSQEAFYQFCAYALINWHNRGLLEANLIDGFIATKLSLWIVHLIRKLYHLCASALNQVVIREVY